MQSESVSEVVQVLNAAAARSRIERLQPSEILAVIGFARESIAEILRDGRGMKQGVFFLETADSPTTEDVLSRLLDDLSHLAKELWPIWYGTDVSARDIAAITKQDAKISAPWLRAAMKHAGAQKPPRFKRTPLALEFEQLMRAIDPSDLILVAELNPRSVNSSTRVIEALEWCSQHGATILVTFVSRPPLVPPFDRVLYRAIEVAGDPLASVEKSGTVEGRFIAGQGRAHPGSVIEQRLEAALQRDEQLGSLFSCNEAIMIDGYGAPRVDLLWREGRVVVEIDGPEHQRDPNFGNDRHRDYELLVAGYTVLRLTNTQVAIDLQRAIEKIRDVVNFRQKAKNVVRQ